MITNQFEGREVNTEANRGTTALSNGNHAPMTNEAIAAAAREDRDAHSLTESNIKRPKGAPRTKVIRRALKLTQEEFAVRYHIPLGTLRDWEQGRSEPDQATRAYLVVIARDPDHVNRVLNQPPDNQSEWDPPLNYEIPG
jgi:putative transcriptional regulator